jgi:hypothetical protein
MTIYCENCGNPLPNSDSVAGFCENCGSPIPGVLSSSTVHRPSIPSNDIPNTNRRMNDPKKSHSLATKRMMIALGIIGLLIVASIGTMSVIFSHQSTSSNSKSTTILTSSGNGLVILSSTEYVDNVNFTHVIGEVKNEGTQNVELVEVTATFFNSQHDVVATQPASVMMDILVPGQTAPFDALTNQTGLGVASYQVAVTNYLPTQNSPTTSLSMVGVTSHVDNLGFFHLLGQVTNNGNSVANLTEVVATFYSSSGSVIAVQPSSTEPDNIPTGQSGSFDALTNTNVNSIASYSVQAEANTLSLTEPPSVATPIIGIVNSSGSTTSTSTTTATSITATTTSSAPPPPTTTTTTSITSSTSNIVYIPTNNAPDKFGETSIYSALNTNTGQIGWVFETAQSDSVYTVSNNQLSQITSIDGTPSAIAFDTENNLAYITYFITGGGPAGLSVISGNTVSALSSPCTPYGGVAYDPHYNYLFIGCGAQPMNIHPFSGIAVLDPISGREIANMSTGLPSAFAYDSHDGSMFVVVPISSSAATIYDIQLSGSSISSTSFSVGSDILGIVYNPSDGYLYLASQGDIIIANPSTGNIVGYVATSANSSVTSPMPIVYDSSNDDVYVFEPGQLWTISGTTASQVASLHTVTSAVYNPVYNNILAFY